MIRRWTGPAAFAAACLTFIAALRFPAGVLTESYHMDLNWWYAINALKDHSLEFGRDIQINWGPFSFLYKPLAVHDHLSWSWAFYLTLYALVLAGAALFLSRTRDFAAAAIIVFAAGIFYSHGALDDWLFPLIAVLFFFEDLSRKRGLLWAVPAALAALTLFIKVNASIVLTAQFAVYLVFSRILRGDSAARIASKALFYLGVFAALAALHFSAPLHVLRWLYGTCLFVAGHSARSALPFRLEEMALALGLLAFILPLAVFIRRRTSGGWAALWLLLISLPAAMAFKHGFARSDWHILYFFSALPVLLSTSALLLPWRGLLPALAIAGLLAAAGPAFRYGDPGLYPEEKTVEASVLLRPAAAIAAAREKNAEVLAGHALTPAEIDLMRGGSAAVAPYDVLLLAGTGLRWKPSPVFLYFAVFSQKLDEMNRAHIAEGDPADYLVVNWKGLDGRHPFYLSPAAWLAALGRYRFHAQAAPERIILKRDDGMKALRTRPAGSERARFGEKIPVPPSEGMVLAKITARYSLLGMAMRIFFRPPPTFLQFIGDDGTAIRFRFDIATAREGLLVRSLPLSLGEMRALFETGDSGSAAGDAASIMIEAFGAGSAYEPAVSVDFFEVVP